MSMVRSLTGVVVTLLAFVLALSSNFEIGVSADTVIVRNKFEKNKTQMRVVCFAYVDWKSIHFVEPGKEVAVAVLYSDKLLLCNGYWRYGGAVLIYRSYLDHEACKDKCIVEVRDDGSFRWNQTEKAWDLIDKLPHYYIID